MCCIANKAAKEEFLKEMNKKRRKTFTAWKVVYKYGRSFYWNYQYSPGIHTIHVTEDTYNRLEPRGIHVYMNKERAIEFSLYFSETLIPVQCHVDDLAVMSSNNCFMGSNYKEAVMTKIKILKEDWVEAKLPIKKGR